ncbi:4648_t:CDS:2, partial [Ambispora leptoticha]
LNILESLVNYEILNPQEYIDIPAKNEAIHRMLSIEEIVNTISQSDNTDNKDPSLSTQNRLTIFQKLTRELNSIFIERKTQKTLDDY